MDNIIWLTSLNVSLIACQDIRLLSAFKPFFFGHHMPLIWLQKTFISAAFFEWFYFDSFEVWEPKEACKWMFIACCLKAFANATTQTNSPTQTSTHSHMAINPAIAVGFKPYTPSPLGNAVKIKMRIIPAKSLDSACLNPSLLWIWTGTKRFILCHRHRHRHRRH